MLSRDDWSTGNPNDKLQNPEDRDNLPKKKIERRKGNNSTEKGRAKCRTTDDREIDRVEHNSQRTKRISSERTEQPHRESRD